MLYANPVPVEFVSGQYYDERGTDYYLSPAKLESDYAPVRFERELRLFRKFCRGGAVLDVGCSTGGFLYNLNERFPGEYQRLGTDVSGPALDYAASRGVPVLQGNFLDSSCGPFDAVTFWAVLEHLFEPRLFLERAWSLLNPDGLCFVLVPNMRSLATRLLGTRHRYIYPQHLNYFTNRTLKRFVQERFSVLEIRSMHFNPVVIWHDWRSRGAEVSNRERAQLLQRTTAYKRKSALAPLRLAYRFVELGLGVLNLADNLAVVLRKKSRPNV
jgi:2-polyprenyl-3-methyl-5-hydroxy-6-metoxy-1,4-benzoquinol methylase